jgi:hypothetical protein
MEREIKEELASKESEASKAPSNERREASEDGGRKNVYKTNKQDPIHVMSQIPTLHATPRHATPRHALCMSSSDPSWDH